MMEPDHVLDDIWQQIGVPEVGLTPVEAEPELKITEQPKTKGFRFRYNCEGLSHGGLPGERNQKGKRTYPSVEIYNYVGEARIVVSLVTDESEPKPHAHSLVGRNCNNGICTVQVGPSDMTACFQNLMIQHATRRDAIPILQQRILEHQQIRSMILGSNAEPQMSVAEAEERAKVMAKDMDLSKVKLCFQAYLKDISGRFTRALPPILSNVVYDSHSPNSTALKICRMDRSSGSTRGGEEVYLLCDKVQKEDIEVRFFEMNSAGEVVWEGFGDFGPTDVHRQYAIVFKTPPFRDNNIQQSIGVQVQLRRKSDHEVSDPKPFKYHSPIKDKERISRKRVKRCYPIATGEDLFREIIEADNKFDPATGMNPFGLQPTNRNEIKPMVLGNGVGNTQQLSPGDAKTSYMPVVTQSNMSSGIAAQLPQQQQVNLQQSQQQLLAQQQHPSPQTQGQPTLGPHSHLSEHPKTQQMLLLESRYRQQQRMQQQRLPGSCDQQQQQHSGHPQQQILSAVQQNVQVTQHQQNPQIIHQLQQTVQIQRQQRAVVQQDGNYPFQPQQKLHGSQQNGFQATPRKICSGLQRRGVSKVLVKTEPLDCRELKENLREMDMDVSDLSKDRGLGLDFPTDVRSDAFQLNLPANIEADACVDRHPSKMALENEARESLRRTMEWQKDYGLDINIDDGQEKEINGSLPFEGDKDMSEFVEKTIQFDPNTDYEQGIIELAEQLSEALLMYSQTGDTRALLQAQKHLLSIEDDNGDTPLHLAVIHGQPEALQAILSVVITIKGQNMVNHKNKLDQTPLHLAVITKSLDMVNFLLDCGSDPNILDQNGFNSLHLAVDGRFHVGIESLISSSPGNQGISTIPADQDALNLDGYAALHMAVEKRDHTAVQKLIKSGANKDIPDGKSGRVPLHCAVLAEDFTMLSYLVADAKVNIHAEDFDGNTPLHIASAHNLRAVAALLIAAGANPESRNCDIQNDSDESDTSDNYEDSEDYYDFDEEEEDGDRLGSSALDYAKSDQMRRILLGESYIPFMSPSFETRSESSAEMLKAPYQLESSKPSYRSSPINSSTDSGVHSEERFKRDSLQARSIGHGGGDISSVPAKVKSSLVKALDSRHPTANDWRAFASHLGMGNMVNHLRGFDSPSKVLLDQYELMDGTLAELRQVALGIERKDIVDILNNALNEINAN